MQHVRQRTKRGGMEYETDHGNALKAEVSVSPKVVSCLYVAHDGHVLDTYAPLTIGIVPRLCREAQAKTE